MRGPTSRRSFSKISSRRSSRLMRDIILAALLAAGCLATTPAFALDDAKKPTGANYAAAQAAPYNATGAGIPIGVIEGGPRPATNNNLGARLKGQWGFSGKTPGQVPDDNSAAVLGACLTSSNCPGRHMALVSDTAAGASATHPGVATGADIYTGAISGFGSSLPDVAANDAGFNSFRATVDWMYRPQAAGPAWQQHPSIALYNNSWGPATENDDNGNNRFARFVDYFATSRDTLFVGAAGNDADVAAERLEWPWDAFNGITVGALDQVAAGADAGAYRARVNWSQYWLNNDNGSATDIRGKPDIVAPGVNIADNQTDVNTSVMPNVNIPRNDSGTSFATPMVTGTAALLMQRGLNLPGPSNRNHLAIKSIILNSARKQGIIGQNAINGIAMDNAATSAQASDDNYLNAAGTALRNGATGGGGPKTGNWTPTSWSFNGNFFQTSSPLDDELGTGALDTQRALVQMDGGSQGEKTFNPAGIRPIGWNRDAIQFGAGDHLYPFNFGVAAGTFITATLTWDRIVTEVNGLGGTAGVVDASDTYNIAGLPDLDLRVFYKGLPIASSASFVDNVEHLHFPVWNAGNPFDYEIHVSYPNLFAGANLVDYGLAWWTAAAVPEPASLVILGFGSFVLMFVRRRPR